MKLLISDQTEHYMDPPGLDEIQSRADFADEKFKLYHTYVSII